MDKQKEDLRRRVDEYFDSLNKQVEQFAWLKDNVYEKRRLTTEIENIRSANLTNLTSIEVINDLKDEVKLNELVFKQYCFWIEVPKSAGYLIVIEDGYVQKSDDLCQTVIKCNRTVSIELATTKEKFFKVKNFVKDKKYMFSPSISFRSDHKTGQHISRIITVTKDSMLKVNHLQITNLIIESIDQTAVLDEKLKHIKTIEFVYKDNCNFDLKSEIYHTIQSFTSAFSTSLESVTINISNFKNLILTSGFFDKYQSLLKTLVLNENEVKKVDPNTFQETLNLEKLDLSKSGLKVTLNHVNLTSLKQLASLNLSQNGVQTIKKNRFDGLTNLTMLDLSQNELENIEFLIPTLSQLTVLNLNENKLANLAATTFTNVPNLQKLYLNSNKLVKIDVSLFKPLSKLTDLGLDFNDFEPELGQFNGLASLKTLTLEGNKLKVLKSGLFRELEQLEDLNLAGNELGEVTSGMFDGLVRLKRLDLARNKLFKIENAVFAELGCLLVVDLTGNAAEAGFTLTKSKGMPQIDI